ncbi:hypothetical protein F441_15297 [Phytophthora nicotianae CJ01A1]|uniref:RxLR effector protein n=2 Tax=Phytophthora nicotianae TaxID=4792 RepID=W2WFB4_PHYNI|nr:hypothetical protein L916_14927 [Phytophthora nicotianae]ETP08783.1 hypothetical protein F441_15297 [Phytophthora nicotianae CJ01A1]
MRSLLLIVLSTLVVFLTSTGAVPPNAPNLKTVTKNQKYILTWPAEDSVNEKRSLRADRRGVDMEAFKTDDEERGSTIMERLMAPLYGLKLGLSPSTQSKWVLRYEEQIFTKLYNAKETPVSLRAKYTGRNGNAVFHRFKAWYEKKVAAKRVGAQLRILKEYGYF